MFCDEIVEEIRKKRQEHAAKFNYDLNKIVADLNAKQSLHKRKVVSFQSKPPRIERIAMNIS